MSQYITLAEQMTPALSAAGGVLLGLSSAYNLYCAGRITGISGLFRDTLRIQSAASAQVAHQRDTWAWPTMFISGMTCGGALLAIQFPSVFGFVSQSDDSTVLVGTYPGTIVAVALGGILVGFGSSMGSGCTSGHGVCGLSRLSVRSAAAVSTFMATGIGTASIVHHSDSLSRIFRSGSWSSAPSDAGSLLEATTAIVPFFPYVAYAGLFGLAMRTRKLVESRLLDCDEDVKSMTRAWISGSLFSVGLAIGGMTDPVKVLSFLTISPGHPWDPSLAFVMGGAVIAAAPAFYLIRSNMTEPKFSTIFRIPTSNAIDFPLLTGAAIFGTGWGLCGFCPGPALAAFGSGSVPAIVSIASIMAGMRAYAAFRGSPPQHHNSSTGANTGISHLSLKRPHQETKANVVHCSKDPMERWSLDNLRV